MIFQRFFISVLLLAPVFGAAAPDLPTFSEEKDSRVLLFEHSVLWPSRGMPHEVKAYFKQVEVLPTSTTKVSLVPSRAQRHLATFAQPKSHAAFLKTPYFYKVFDEMMLFIERFQKTKNLKTTFSVLFDRSQREDAIVTSFDFEKKNNKIVCNLVVNALTQTVDTELVNLVQSLICDDSLVARHWGKGLFATAALLAVIFKKELPLGIGKKFQSFYEQAEREVARVYPGIFGEWQPFVAGTKFAKKNDDPSYAIILVSNKDSESFRLMGSQQIKAKLNGVTKTVVVLELVAPGEAEPLVVRSFSNAIHRNSLCFPLKTTVGFRNLSGVNSLAANPLNFNQNFEIAEKVREQFFDLLRPRLSSYLWFRSSVEFGGLAEDVIKSETNFKGPEKNTTMIVVSPTHTNFMNKISRLEVCFEDAERDVSADETTRKPLAHFDTGRRVRQCFYQKIIVRKLAPQSSFKLFANGIMQEFVKVDDLMSKIRFIADTLSGETKGIDLLTQKFEEHRNLPEIFQKEILNKCNVDGARDWIAESPGTVGWHLRRDGSTETLISMTSVFVSELNSYKSWNYIHVSFECEMRDIPAEETQPKARKLIESTKSVTVYDQKIVVYRNADNKLVLVAGGASQVLENLDDLWTKIKEIALARHAERREEDLFTATFGELAENPDRPKAFDELRKTPRREAGLLEQDIALLSDEDFADLPRNDDGSIKAIGHDGAEKNITEAEALKLRGARLKLGEFVSRMKKTNDAEAEHARTLLVEPKADGDNWAKVADIVSQLDLLSVDKFKKAEAYARRIFDLEKSREQYLLDALRTLSAQFMEEIKAAIPGSIVSYSRERSSYNFKLTIGEDSLWIVIADPYGYVFKRMYQEGDNLSTRQITRVALVADFINTDPQCAEYRFSAPQMKLCLRKGATKEGSMDDRFLIAIQKIESAPAVGAGVGAASATFTVSQLCKIAQIMQRAGTIAWDDRSLVSIPPVEGSGGIGSHRFMNLTARKGFFFKKYKCPELKPFMSLDRIPDSLFNHEFDEVIESRRIGRIKTKLFSKIYPRELDGFLFERVCLLFSDFSERFATSGIVTAQSGPERELQRYCFRRRLVKDWLVKLVDKGLLDQQQSDRIEDFWLHASNAYSFLDPKRQQRRFADMRELFRAIPLGVRKERTAGLVGHEENDSKWAALLEYERNIFTPAYEAALKERLENSLMAKEDSLSRVSFRAGEELPADGVGVGAGAAAGSA